MALKTVFVQAFSGQVWWMVIAKTVLLLSQQIVFR